MFRGLKSLLPGSLGLRVFLLYALSLLLTLTVGLTAFMLMQFSRHIDDAEAAATTLSQVMVQTIADSAVIGDYDTIEKTLRKALSRSPFDNASFIDLKGGRIQVAAPKMSFDSQPPEWVVRRAAARLEPINTIISAGGRDYGVLRLIFASERIAAEVWDVLRATLLLGLGGLAFGLAVIGIPIFRWMRNLKRIDDFEAEIRDGRIDPTRVIDADAPIEIRRAFDVLSRTAATLQAQREKADVTLHAVADGVLTLDAQGIVVYANPAAVATLARPAVALLGAPIAELLPGADISGRHAAGWQHRRFRVPAQKDAGQSSADAAADRQTDRMLDTSLAPIEAGEGQPAGYVLACHDVTEAYRLDLRLREEFASRQQALESLRGLLLRLVPASRRASIERDSDDITAVSEMLSELVREREASRSSLVRAKLDAEASNRAKSEFLANMSHEIRTPMNAILGLSELVLSTPLSEQQHEHLSLVKTSADSLLGIINDILDFSKIEAGRMDMESMPFELEPMLSELLRPYKPQAQARGLNLEFSIEDDVPARVIGDPLRVGQVLTNLIGNALKFTRHGSVRLQVRAYRAGEGKAGIRFEVVDTGIGIEPVKLQGIFEAFSQADSSITRRYGGTGLGLTISRRLALAMGGDLRVDSALGQGSTFTFDAPLSVAPRTEALAKTEMPHGASAAQALQILLVEDNVINQKLAVALLGQAGHTVTVASDGEEGVARWREGRFDAILMDVQMPVLDGLQATRRIREHERNTEHHAWIIAMTANAMAGDRERCIAAGMDDYLAKPFRRADLQAVLNKVPKQALDLAAQPVKPDPAAASDASDASDAYVALARASQNAQGNARREGSSQYRQLLLQVDPDIVDIIGAAFLRQYPQAMSDVDQAAASGERSSLLRSAHSLKGLFRTFNAEEPARLAMAIEQICLRPDADLSKVPEITQLLRREGDAFCGALSVRLNDLSVVSEGRARA